MKAATTLFVPAVLALAVGCAGAPPRTVELTLPVSSNSVLRSDRLQRMPGSTALDALRTLPTYTGRTTRVPTPRFILILDGTRTTNLDMLNGIQASDVYEIKVIGESQSLGTPGDVEIVVTTIARHQRAGH